MFLLKIVSDFLIFLYFSIRAPGAGSDHKTFYMRLGIPIVDIRYTYNWVSLHYFFAKTYHFLQSDLKKEPIPSVLKLLRVVVVSTVQKLCTHLRKLITLSPSSRVKLPATDPNFGNT